ncbi:MAG: DUF262 domain-containing protein [Microscillaceae bacterium]|nr:DUF262 domain-containing protein [Microscillaceae bacterium]
MSEEEIFFKQLEIFSKREESEKFFKIVETVLDYFNLNFSDRRIQFSIPESGSLSLSLVIGKKTILLTKRNTLGLHLALLLPYSYRENYQSHPNFLETLSKVSKQTKSTQDQSVLVGFDFIKLDLDKKSDLQKVWYDQINKELNKNPKAKRNIHSIHFYNAIIDHQYRNDILKSINFKMTPSEIQEREIEVEDDDVSDYEFEPQDVKITNEPRSLDSIINRIKYSNIDLNPDFQRNAELWSRKIMSRLIESILLRLPLPVFYFDASDDDKWLVVDGLQRLATLQKFVIYADQSSEEYSDRLILDGLKVLKEYNNKDFNELPGSMKRRLNEFQVTVYLIQPGTPEEVKYSIFHRINTGGLKLNPQEIRNALNQKGEAPKYLKDLADSEIFKKVVNINPKRMKNREIVLRFLAFQVLNADDYKGNISIFLDKAMKKINQTNEQELKGLEDKYIKSLKINDKLFGEHSFSKSISRGKIQFNTALYEVWTFYLTQLNIEEGEKIIQLKTSIIDEFISLLNQKDFDDSISGAFTDTRNVETRFQKIYKLLKDLNFNVKPWKE